MTRAKLIAPVAATVLLVACTSSTHPVTHSSSSPTPQSSVLGTGVTRPGTSPTAASRVPTIALSHLDGATVPTTFVLKDDTAGVTEAKFYLTTHGKTFLYNAKAAPFSTAVSVSPGANSIQIRHEIAGSRERVDVEFTAKAGLLTGSSSTPAPNNTTSSAPAVTQPAATVQVANSVQLRAALAAAVPGAVIRLADGVYQNTKGNRWALSRSGVAGRPITLEGTRAAVVQSDSPKGDYGLWITGSYWQVLGITIRNATKGVVLDGSQHTVLSDIEVYNIGAEGVHFRSCSSGGVLQNSYVHDTGVDKPNFGEGVYVGSANSNWSKYGCQGGQDKSENTVIENNVFRHIAAEGADLKEGTDSGSLVGNTFDDTGYSGENSADSAVDAKGNNWVISGNTVSHPAGSDLDAFQSHSVYAGYGTANVFSNNHVLGTWPGFGIALHPQAANVVTCDNTAPGAAKGLVGADGKAIQCSS